MRNQGDQWKPQRQYGSNENEQAFGTHAAQRARVSELVFPFSSGWDGAPPPQRCLRECPEPDVDLRDDELLYQTIDGEDGTHGSVHLLSDDDMLDSIVLDRKLAFSREPDGLLVGPAAPAFFLRLSSEIEVASRRRP